MEKEEFKKEFIRLLENYGQNNNFRCNKYHSNGRHTNNIIELTGSVNCLVYFHIRTGSTPATWGITKTRIEELKGTGQKWMIVLLYKEPNSGYLLNATDVYKSVDQNIWPLGKNNNNKNEYKINGRVNDMGRQSKTLKYSKPFQTFGDFYSLLCNA